MFLPIGDSPRPRIVTVATYALILANVAVFLFVTLPLQGAPVDPKDPLLATYLEVIGRHSGLSPIVLFRQASAYDLFTFRHGFRPADRDVLSLVVSLFLHAGWLHLLGNMLFLWIFGGNVEQHLGRVRFVLLYLSTGVLATLFFALFATDPQVPLIGASGAISGVLGSYFVWFGQHRVRVLLVLFVFVDVIMLPARWVLGFFVLIDNVLPFLVDAGGGVAYGAHIGGFLAGVGGAYLFNRLGSDTTDTAAQAVSGAGTERIWPRAATVIRGVDGFHEAVETHNFDSALAAYADLTNGERLRLGDEDLLSLADHLAETGRHDIALALLQRLIATRPNSPFLARAHLRAGLIQLYGRGRSVAATQHLLTVLDLDEHGLLAQAARQALSEIAARESSHYEA